MNRWLKQEYPAIAAQAKAEGAEIYWGDQTGVNNKPNAPRGYAPRGATLALNCRAIFRRSKAEFFGRPLRQNQGGIPPIHNCRRGARLIESRDAELEFALSHQRVGRPHRDAVERCDKQD